MRWSLGIICWLACGAFVMAEESDELSLADLQGRWLMVSMHKGGKELLPEDEVRLVKCVLEVKEDTYFLSLLGKQVQHGTLQLDASQSPATLDQELEVGEHQGKVQRSIVRIVDGELEWCQAEAGGDRPKKFASAKGSSHTLARFERAAVEDEPGLDISRTVDVEEDDAKMNAAIAEARKSVGDFIKALKKPGKDQESFAVKMPIEGKEKVEHFWLTDVRFDGKVFHGKIGNDPEFVEDIAFGDAVTVKREEISDWMYVDKGVLVGGYTIRVLRDGLSEKDRRELDESLPFTIE